MFGIGTGELILFGLIAVILFGGRLPTVARSLGKSIVEFKKGMKDIEDDLKSSIYAEPDNRIGYDDRSEPRSPRFEPPKAEQTPVTSDKSGHA